MKDLTIEVGVENAGLSAGEGVDCNLLINDQQMISDSYKQGSPDRSCAAQIS